MDKETGIRMESNLITTEEKVEALKQAQYYVDERKASMMYDHENLKLVLAEMPEYTEMLQVYAKKMEEAESVEEFGVYSRAYQEHINMCYNHRERVYRYACAKGVVDNIIEGFKSGSLGIMSILPKNTVLKAADLGKKGLRTFAVATTRSAAAVARTA